MHIVYVYYERESSDKKSHDPNYKTAAAARGINSECAKSRVLYTRVQNYRKRGGHKNIVRAGVRASV